MATPLWLVACAPAPSADYFPLEPGHRWVYESRSEWENQTQERETLALATLGREPLPDDVAGGGSAWRRRSDSGVDYWLRSDASGIFRVASKTDLQADPVADAAPRYVLKSPLAVGTTWQASTTAYLLRRNAEFPPEIRHTHKPVPMSYQIAAVGEKLSTRAGDFSDCIRVQGQAVMKLFADPVVGFRDMPLATTEWYCRGVGLVKLERHEPANNSTFLQGGKLVMELVEWQ
ncbi:MAG: hypothetical protein KBC73_12515 [Burkholderiaceae bacterium]|nr:hypothetical protein [Burkholderiaceae bacterium]